MNPPNSMITKDPIDKNMPNIKTNQNLPLGQQTHTSNQSQLPQEVYPPFNANQNYYQEFWRIYLQNELLISQMKDYVKDVTNLKAGLQTKTEQLQQLRRQIEQNQKSQGKKKNRRIDADIEKSYACPYPNCGKNYATEVSMNLHIKLKHKGGNKTEREKYARQLLQASDSEKAALLEELNLPPGYLDNSISQQLPVDSSQFLEQSIDKGINNNQN